VLRLIKGAKGARTEPAQPDVLAGVVRAALASDQAAIRTLLVTVGPHLLRVVRKVLGARHPDVDDVVQDSAFAVLDALPAYRGECSVLHFVCRVAFLTAMAQRRRDAARKRASVRDDDVLVDLLPGASEGPDAALAQRVAAQALRELLDALPMEQAEALALHCALGYTVAEVAALCGAPVETVRSRLRLAKHALRERILGDHRLLPIVEVQ
jgi:RNA polymerase sigma-70 factor (ECF subfamily)